MLLRINTTTLLFYSKFNKVFFVFLSSIVKPKGYGILQYYTDYNIVVQKYFKIRIWITIFLQCLVLNLYTLFFSTEVFFYNFVGCGKIFIKWMQGFIYQGFFKCFFNFKFSLFLILGVCLVSVLCWCTDKFLSCSSCETSSWEEHDSCLLLHVQLWRQVQLQIRSRHTDTIRWVVYKTINLTINVAAKSVSCLTLRLPTACPQFYTSLTSFTLNSVNYKSLFLYRCWPSWRLDIFVLHCSPVPSVQPNRPWSCDGSFINVSLRKLC